MYLLSCISHHFKCTAGTGGLRALSQAAHKPNTALITESATGQGHSRAGFGKLACRTSLSPPHVFVIEFH